MLRAASVFVSLPAGKARLRRRTVSGLSSNAVRTVLMENNAGRGKTTFRRLLKRFPTPPLAGRGHTGEPGVPT